MPDTGLGVCKGAQIISAHPLRTFDRCPLREGLGLGIDYGGPGGQPRLLRPRREAIEPQS